MTRDLSRLLLLGLLAAALGALPATAGDQGWQRVTPVPGVELEIPGAWITLFSSSSEIRAGWRSLAWTTRASRSAASSRNGGVDDAGRATLRLRVKMLDPEGVAYVMIGVVHPFGSWQTLVTAQCPADREAELEAMLARILKSVAVTPDRVESWLEAGAQKPRATAPSRQDRTLPSSRRLRLGLAQAHRSRADRDALHAALKTPPTSCSSVPTAWERR